MSRYWQVMAGRNSAIADFPVLALKIPLSLAYQPCNEYPSALPGRHLTIRLRVRQLAERNLRYD